MKSRLLYTLFASLLTTVSVSVQAAPLSYDEAIDGDINRDFFLLDIGTNTITGDTELNNPGTDFDIFDFDLAPGTQVNSISYEFTNVVERPGTSGFGLGMDTGSGNLGDWEIDVLNDASPVSILGEILPLSAGAGPYTFDYYLWRFGGSADPFGGQWDYTLTFEVGPATVVPVPAAIWLFGSGMLGMIGIARRKKAA